MALHPFAYSCKSPETLTSASRSLSLIVMSLNSLRYGVRLESAAYWVLGRMKTSQCVMPRRPADWPNSGLSGVSSNTSRKATCVSFHLKTSTPSGSSTRKHSARSEEHTSELQSLMRISYAVFCLKKKKHNTNSKE